MAKQIKITAADVQAADSGRTRKGKEVDPTSGRQRILQVLKASEVPLTPAQINAQVERIWGMNLKWVSSHLDYFKKQGQVVREEGSKYRLAEDMYDRVSDIVLENEEEGE